MESKQLVPVQKAWQSNRPYAYVCLWHPFCDCASVCLCFVSLPYGAHKSSPFDVYGLIVGLHNRDKYCVTHTCYMMSLHGCIICFSHCAAALLGN